MSAVRYWWATGLGLVALFLALALWDPAVAGGPDLCLFHRATGVACAACGLTRAAAALAQGKFAESWRWHPLFALLAVEAAIFWLAWGVALRRARTATALSSTQEVPEPPDLLVLRRIAPKAAIATGLLLLLVWIVRLAAGTLPA
ncbi:MAG: DUF2752 domain-containing protein [Thermoanaerobaculia bacterium]|jgi:hypothetical protein|nr:DUF2752 domain-containing protein [Thermoanaerobaculia bacterium]MBP9824817.1 DUF2752 domain-containing protein [Thermoanaerobaculia bacterium]